MNHACRTFFRAASIGLSFFPAVSPAQWSRPEGAGVPDSAALGFERNYSTYRWRLRADYLALAGGTSVDFHEDFTSDLIRRGTNSIRDTQNDTLRILQHLLPDIDADVELSSLITSDNQSLGVSNVAVHSGVAGLRVSPVDGVTITPLAGFRYDRQQGHVDQGPNYRLLAETDTLDFSGYAAAGAARLNVSTLSPRYFRNNGAAAFIRKDFGGGSLDSLRFGWLNSRWDFYIPGDANIRHDFGVSDNIRTRSEEGFLLSNLLAYQLSATTDAAFHFNVTSRSIANDFRYQSLAQPSAIPFNTGVQELDIDAELDLEFAGPGGLLGIAGIAVGERDERHSLERISGADEAVRAAEDVQAREESSLDNVGRTTRIHGLLAAPVSDDDHLEIEGSAGILRYDTPDTTNYEDRDELLVSSAFRASHRFSRSFNLRLVTEATLAHVVYLFSERSANNNWNRIFRMSLGSDWNLREVFRSTNIFEVLANYTVFDFESVVPDVRSYSYRQSAFLDSTSYDMTARMSAEMDFYVRVYERGELFWSAFAEQPQQSVEEATFSPSLRYTLHNGMIFGAGFRSFAQNRYRYVDNHRVYDGDYFSYGPTALVIIALSPVTRLEIHGWKEFQQQSGVRGAELSNVSMSVRAYF